MKQILLFIGLFVALMAQTQEANPPEMEQGENMAQTIEALKTAYITKDLNLTPDEAQKFWPVYNGFADEIKKARTEHKDDDIAFEEKRVAIMKKYRENFRKILNNDDRVKRCFKTERDFHQLLRKEILRRKSIRLQQQINPNRFKNNRPPIKPGVRPN
jgi:hypothetical protein